MMGKTTADIKKYLPYIAPYTFRLPASPHLAAAYEKKQIDDAKIKDSFQRLSSEFDFVVVEGIGGALVPFNTDKLVIDIASELSLPVIIVAANKLGAINHTLLTIEAVKSRGMEILGVIFNAQSEVQNRIILEDNPKIIEALTGQRVLGSLSWLKDKDLLYKEFAVIGDKILTEMDRKSKNE